MHLGNVYILTWYNATWCNGSPTCLYLAGPWFEFQLGYWLLWLKLWLLQYGQHLDSWIRTIKYGTVLQLLVLSICEWWQYLQDGFTSLDDYLCYVYAARSTLSGNSNCRVKKVDFPDTAVREVGPYRLLYFSHNSGSVLGMSEAFGVCRRDNGQLTQFVCRDSY